MKKQIVTIFSSIFANFLAKPFVQCLSMSLPGSSYYTLENDLDYLADPDLNDISL